VLLVKHHVRHGTVLLGLYVSRENGGVTLQKNFNAGELRYVRNIPGGRRQRASVVVSIAWWVNQLDAALAKLIDEGYQVFDWSAEAVEAPDDEHVAPREAWCDEDGSAGVYFSTFWAISRWRSKSGNVFPAQSFSAASSAPFAYRLNKDTASLWALT
jgi:hypothetical protein